MVGGCTSSGKKAVPGFGFNFGRRWVQASGETAGPGFWLQLQLRRAMGARQAARGPAQASAGDGGCMSSGENEKAGFGFGGRWVHVGALASQLLRAGGCYAV